MNLWQAFFRHRLIVQFIEYLVGGGVYFWSGYATFAFCYSVLHWHWIWAKAAADVLGWTLGFVVQRYWAFDSPAVSRKATMVTKRYVLLSICNFVIDYAIVGGLRMVHVSPYAGLFISSMFFTVWNYLWYRFWVFNPPKLTNQISQ